MIKISNTQNGHIVKLDIQGAPEMVVTDVVLDQNKLECRYWNEQEGIFKEYFLTPDELIAVNDDEPDYETTYEVGEKVTFITEPLNNMIVVEGINGDKQYLCRYFNSLKGTIEEELFYGFELGEPSKEYTYTID